jgi:hypothetical protein
MDIEFSLSINAGLNGDTMARVSSCRLVLPFGAGLTPLTVDHLVVRALHGQFIQVAPPVFCVRIQSLFSVPCCSVAPVQRHILHLDSTTDTKFSRHLVITIPGVVWADNSHAGAAVTAFVLRCCTACGVSLGQEITKDALIVRHLYFLWRLPL